MIRFALCTLLALLATPVHAQPICMQAVLAGSKGHQPLVLRIAHTPEGIEQGLMGVAALPPNYGMLFVFEDAYPWTFWMHNTPAPLDIVPLDDEGRVIEVMEGEPFSTTHLIPSQPVRRVLEVQAGTIARLGANAPDGALVIFDGANCPHQGF